MKRLLAYRRTIVLVLVALIISVSAAVVLAASPHYKKGSPVCTVSGLTGSCSGTIAGLGNEDVKITVSLTGTAQPFCAAPGNPENVVPGQNPVPLAAAGSVTIPADLIENGNLTFGPVTATAVVPTLTAVQAGCQNPNWNVTVSQATITSLTLTIEQPEGTLIDSLTRTFPF